MNFTQMVAEQTREELKADITNLKKGQFVRYIGLGAMAKCFPPETGLVIKINKKTVALGCGKKIKHNQIVEVIC
jgi:hypothetical protein